jgi:hypothetical protein
MARALIVTFWSLRLATPLSYPVDIVRFEEGQAFCFTVVQVFGGQSPPCLPKP